MVKINITKLKCLRCGKEWIPKKEDVRQCPKCKSAWWDKPK
jgi:DNA-directed RNA polymerase subunit RPC12/RpoP